MLQLKPIDREAIPRSLAKAERYRFLHEPREAESICRDILAAEPDHQAALVMLVLSLTDQFSTGTGTTPEHTKPLLARLHDPYERAYYTGVVNERWGKHQHESGSPGYVVYDWFADAMESFEKAESLAPGGNEDAVLRWNSCARTLAISPDIRPRPEDLAHPAAADEDVPSSHGRT